MESNKIQELNETLLNHFGIDNQLHKLEEKLTELFIAVKRVRSGRIGIISYTFMEELADVENLLCQIKIEVCREFRSNGESEFCIENALDTIKTDKISRVFKDYRIEKHS